MSSAMSDGAFEAAYIDEVRRSFRGYKRMASMPRWPSFQTCDFFQLPDPESIALLIW